jgi:hypothetical protein
MLVLFIFVLLLHLFGDFFVDLLIDVVFQSDWIADNKAKNWEALCLHVFFYAVVLFVGTWLTHQYTLNENCRFALINGGLHLLTDKLTSIYSKSALDHKKTQAFFAVLGIDQFVHSITLLVTANYLLGVP